MKKLLALAIGLMSAVTTINLHHVNAQVRPQYSNDRYIVVLKEGVVLPGQVPNVARALAQRARGRVGFLYRSSLQGFSILMPAAAVAELSQDPRVAYIEADVPVSIHAQELPTGIRRINADTNPNLDIDTVDDLRVDVDVAVIDTGIALDHPDLNVVGGTNCLQGLWFFGNYCDDAISSYDDNTHGTHVAGSIGALDNGIGVVGVAPGARLWSVKALDAGGSGYLSGIIAAIDWVVAQGNIEVINMSLSATGQNTSFADAVQGAVNTGVVVVAAAGNNNDNASNYSPAFVPDAITVSAIADFNGQPGGGAASTCRVDQDDTNADFSNFGSVVDIAAPGVCINSTIPPALDSDGDGYAIYSGTSMAAPHVAGAAALLTSGPNRPQNRNDVLAIRNQLVNSGGTDWVDNSGDGILEPLLNVADPTIFNPTFVSGGTGNIAPTANFNNACNALTCNFTDTSVDADGSIVSWSWDFGDGNTSTNQNPSHTYAVAGTYTVLLTVTDNTGDTANRQQTVTVGDASAEISLIIVSPYWVGRTKYVDLFFTALPQESVDVEIFRNGKRVGTMTTDALGYGITTDTVGNTRKVSSYTYKVCQASTNNCSNEMTVTF